MVKKGQEGVFLAICFMIIIVVVIATISLAWIGGTEQKTMVESDIGIYTSVYALKFAKLYLETSLSYSVYQAMYDIGRNGGWPEKREELINDRSGLEKNLKSEILKNLNEYVTSNQIYNFRGKEVNLPEYRENRTLLSDSPSGLNVSVEGDRNIFLKEVIIKKLGRESISIELSSRLEDVYDFEFFSLYNKAVEILNGITDCKDDMRTEGDYEIILNADKDVKPCNVSVSVIDTYREFPVFDGANVSFEPVSFEFLVRIT